MREAERILAEYARREREIPGDFYSLAKPGNLFIYQQRVRALIRLLRSAGYWPLACREILDLGCGSGDWLVDFLAWGASRDRLHGIDLDEGRAARARERTGADVRIGDASRLPWPDGFFDLVLQSTVFTSILDPSLRRAVAAEMLRVLRPEGSIIWYDFRYDNPGNPHVAGISRLEIAELFPGCRVGVTAITLAPPVARRVVPITWVGALLLEKLPPLRTHYLALIRPVADGLCHARRE